MEEKVLAQSVHYNPKKAIKPASIVCVILIVLSTAVSWFVGYEHYNKEYTCSYDYDKGYVPYEDDSTEDLPRCEHTGEYETSYEKDYYYSYSYGGYLYDYDTKETWKYYDGFTYADFKEAHPTVFSYVSCIGKSIGDVWNIPLIFLTGIGVWIVVVVIILIINAAASKYSLTVTNMRVYGNTLHGKRVDLPIDSVSSFASSRFKGIAIGTSSGKIKFNLIKNRDEMFSALSSLIVERQATEQPKATVVNETSQPLSSADELKKFKQLLDDGVITQEEFDAKKRELLGL